MSLLPPKSLRDNNPGNLRATATPWRGLTPREQLTPEQLADGFCVFVSPPMGFRAQAVNAITHWRRGQRSVAALIPALSPPVENPTADYIKNVCAAMQCAPGEFINLLDRDTLRAFCRACAVQEAGRWLFIDPDLDVGVDLALTYAKSAA